MTMRSTPRDVPLIGFLFLFACLLLAWHALVTAIYLKLYPTLDVSPAFLAAHKKCQFALLFSGWLLPVALAWRRLTIPSRPSAALAWTGVAAAIGVAIAAHGFWVLAATTAVLLGIHWKGVRPVADHPRWQKISWALALAACAGLFWFVYPRYDYRIIDLYDDGPKLSAVQEALRGRKPYRDFTIHYGPLRDVAQPLIAFRLWGVTYDSEQRIRAVVQSAGAALMLGIVFAVSRSLLWTLVVGFVLAVRNDLVIPERVTPVLLTAFLFCLRLQMKTGSRATWTGFLAGLSAAATLLYSFEMGFTLLVGMVFSAGLIKWVDREKMDSTPWRDAGMGLGVAAVLFGIYLVSISGLQWFVLDTGALLFKRLGTWSDFMPSHLFSFRRLFEPDHVRTYIYLHAVPLFCLGVAGSVFWQRRQQEPSVQDGALVFLSATLSVQYVIYMSRTDLAHWVNATGLLWPLIAIVLFQLLQSVCHRSDDFRSTRVLRVMGVAAGWTLLFPWLRGQTPLWLNTLNTVQRESRDPLPRPSLPPPVLERMGALPGTPAELAQIQQITRWIQTEVGYTEPFFVFGIYGTYNFLADRLNPTRYGLIDMAVSSRMVQNALADLQAHPPRAVLVQFRENDPSRWEFRPDLQPIADYLQAHYALKYRQGLLALWVPKNSSAPRQ